MAERPEDEEEAHLDEGEEEEEASAGDSRRGARASLFDGVLFSVPLIPCPHPQPRQLPMARTPASMARRRRKVRLGGGHGTSCGCLPSQLLRVVTPRSFTRPPSPMRAEEDDDGAPRCCGFMRMRRSLSTVPRAPLTLFSTHLSSRAEEDDEEEEEEEGIDAGPGTAFLLAEGDDEDDDEGASRCSWVVVWCGVQ